MTHSSSFRVLVANAGLRTFSIALLVLGFAPLLGVFFMNLWKLPQYQFFPLALAGSAFLFHSRLKEASPSLGTMKCGHPAAIAVWIGAAALLLATATAVWSPWLASLAAIVAYGGLLVWIGGCSFFRLMFPSWVLLLTIVPPPSFLLDAINTPLRRIAVTASSRFLDLLGVVNALSGNVIEIPGHRLFVEEACSGLNSIVFVSFTFVGYALWKRRGFLYFVVGLPLAWSFVILGNVARITSGAWLKTAFGIDTMHGWKHEAIGLLLVIGYVVLIVSLEHFFSLAPRVANVVEPPESLPQALASPALRRLRLHWSWLAASVFLLIGVTGFAFRKRETIALSMAVDPARFESLKIDLPKMLDGWVQIGDAKPLTQDIQAEGHFTKTWAYQRGSQRASLAVSYPFLGYHDVAHCYEFAGWSITNRSESPTPSTNGAPISEVALFHQGYLHGSLMMGCWNEKGGALQRPDMARYALQARWRGIIRSYPTTFQLQVLINSSVSLPASDLEAQRDLFRAAGQTLSVQLSQTRRGP